MAEEENNKNMVLGKEIVTYLLEEDITLEGFKELFEKGNYDVNAKGKFDNVPLTLAVGFEHKEIVQYLVEHGADLEAKDDEGRTPLIVAIGTGNKEVVQYLVEHGADLEAKDDNGRTPLMEACLWGNKDVVQYLAEHGANVNVKDEHGDTPLVLATMLGNEELSQYLVENGADERMILGNEIIDYLSGDNVTLEGFKELFEKGNYDVNARSMEGEVKGGTPLTWAVCSGNIEIVQYLVENGADLELQNEKGTNALMYAVDSENKEIVQYLIERGADLEVKDSDEGYTPLMHAAELGNKEIVEYLVEHGADVDAKDNAGRTPLMGACLWGNKEIVQYLGEQGADLDAQDNNDWTSLMYATMAEEKEIVEYLAEHGVNLEVKDEQGLTPLLMAITYENKELVECLAEQGANLDARDKDGATSLMYAVAIENKEIIEYLVKHGVDLEAKDKEGRTPLMVAVVTENKEIVEYLVEQGVDLEAKSKDGRTSLMFAVLSGNKEIVECLVEHGADLEAKDNEGMGVTKYYSGEMAREYREKQKEEYDGNAWRRNREHTILSTYNEDADYGGYATRSGEISVGKYRVVRDVSPKEIFKMKRSGEKSFSEIAELEKKTHIEMMNHSFENMMTFVHEGNHRLHTILDGMYDGNFTAKQNVKLSYCTESIAATSECLAAALQYQRMKEAGIEVYQYEDSKGKIQEMPLEGLLERYSPKLKEYVVENGFDPNNQKDVDVVTEIGIQYWKTNNEWFYAKVGGQFDSHAKPSGTGEGVSEKEFNALIERMCEGVVIGDGVELDLRRFAGKFNGMTDEEAQKHISRANGEEISGSASMENNASRQKAMLMSEIKGQEGEAVILEPTDKAKQMRLEIGVDKKSSASQLEAEKNVERKVSKAGKALDVSLNLVYGGRD